MCSNLPIPVKIAITVIVAIKWVLFFFTAFVMDVGIGKSIGFTIGVALNATIIVIAAYTHITPIVANVGVTLGLLILWYIITSFSLPSQ